MCSKVKIGQMLYDGLNDLWKHNLCGKITEKERFAYMRG